MLFFIRLRRALAFLTLLPLGPKVEAGPIDLTTDAQYFPVVGFCIGVFSASVFWLAGHVWPQPVPALLGLLAAIMLTGGLHEDGLADAADGFGGGWTRERRLAIMKDSHIGTYGTLALFFALALKTAVLSLLPSPLIFAALITLHASSRAAIVFALAMLDYAGDPQTAKSPHLQKRLDARSLFIALACTFLFVLPLLLYWPAAALWGFALSASVCVFFAMYSRRAIGGYNGDVLGAIEQIFEVCFLLGISAASGISR